MSGLLDLGIVYFLVFFFYMRDIVSVRESGL